jgi:urea transport system permease protein
VRAVVQKPHHGRRGRHRYRKVDRYTFAIGCGIAGIAGSAFTMIGSTGPTSGQLYIVDTFLVVVSAARPACSAPSLRPSRIAQTQSTAEFFLSGSMAKVVTLLDRRRILMLRPQGLFALKVRR